MTNRNDPCWCNSGKKWKKCHYPQEAAKTKMDIAREYKKKYDILIKTEEQIAGIRAASRLAATILDKLCNMAKEGVTTNELDAYSRQLHKEANAIPATVGYGHPPFPKSICTSLNEVICHGIPDDRPLQDGDIMNIDVTSILGGYYGDCSRMVMIGNVADEAKNLVQTAYDCLHDSIKILRPGVLLSEVGETIHQRATKEGYSVVEQFVGHGVGINFHEGPQVLHCRNRLHIPLVEGMTFTIEPMINIGVKEGAIDPKDGWTARTLDGKLSAQWEHTLLITESGVEILTTC